MNATPSTTTHLQYVWPLPGALLPNGHTTWAEWVASQAKTTIAQQPEREVSSLAGDAWDREARLVFATAAAKGVTVREEALRYLDVHDLRALRQRIANRDDAHQGHDPRREHAA